MSALLFVGMGQAVFLAVLILGKRPGKVFDYLLASWLLVSTLQMYFFHLNFVGQTERYVPLLLAGGLLPFIAGPLLYLYVLAIVKKGPFRLWKQVYHLIPFFFFVGNYWYFYYFGGEQARVWVAEGYLHFCGQGPSYMGYYGLILAFFSCLYPCLSLYELIRHRRRLQDRFSYTEKITLDWLRYWIVLSLIGFWSSFIIIWAGSWQWVTMENAFMVVSGHIVFNVFVIGIFGLRQGSIFTNYEPRSQEEAVESTKYGNSSLTTEKEDFHAKALEAYMEREQPFLDAKLTIDELARQLSVSRHHLSQVINSQFDKNFFDYVNEYRVRTFEEKLRDPRAAHLTLLGIGLQSGFNSKSSFNQIVKKLRGVTPSELKKELQGTA